MDIPNILIVDDEPNNFDVIEALLDNQDYQLHYAANGKDAISNLETVNPDLILLDVMMPGLNGIEVCERIKSMPQWQPVPIIMVTALSTKVDLALCLQSGADDFIGKPVNGLELRSRVHSMLRIKQQYDDLQALLKSREAMVKMMVDDLQSPLSNVLFGLDMLESLSFSKEQQQAKIAQMRFSGRQLRSLIDDILLMAKIESGKLRLNTTQIDFSTLLSSVLSAFEVIAAQKNLELISKLPERGGSINLDTAMFRRVLDNLVSNAIKASPPGSQIILSADYLPSGDVQIQVTDLGSGIPETLKQKIFDKFEIGTLMQDVSQIGLGLAFCKMVVEAHRGEISVKNNKPTGTIFEIILPN